MGAEQFTVEIIGHTAQEAFQLAVDQAAYDHGHSGYTGTIAEKDEYVMVTERYATPLPHGEGLQDEAQKRAYLALIEARREYAEELLVNCDARVNDKWGPAGCIPLYNLPDGQVCYLFFGWASS